MLRIRWFIPVSAWAVAALISSPMIVAQGPSFQIAIPFKGLNTSSAPYPPIGTVKAIITVASNSSVGFTVTPDASPSPSTLSFQPVRPGNTPPPSLAFKYNRLRNDVISIVPPKNATDPPTYQIVFRLQSDFNVGCIAEQNARTFTVSVGPNDPQITNVCLESWDAGPNGSCSPPRDSVRYVPVPADNPKDAFATVVGGAVPTQGCRSQKSRPPTGMNAQPHIRISLNGKSS